MNLTVNPGNSGGPLFDEAGNVVGVVVQKTINTTIISSNGLAIPAKVADQFMRATLVGYRSCNGKSGKRDFKAIDTEVRPSIVAVKSTAK